VAFLPKELGGAKEHAGAQLPAHHVGPLVQEQRQVAIALDPFGEEVADDGFRSRTDHVRLFKLLAARDGDDSEFGGEAFHMLGLFFEEAFRNEEREVGVLMAGGLEAGVEFSLQIFPNGIAVGFDDHAAFHDLGRFGHVALENGVLIPGGEILRARSDG